MNYSTEEIKDLLLDEDYPASNDLMLNSVINQIKNLTPEAKDAFEKWCDSRVLPSFDIEGITPEFLKSNHHCTDIGIILAFDGLIRHPKDAYLLKKPVISHLRKQ